MVLARYKEQLYLIKHFRTKKMTEDLKDDCELYHITFGQNGDISPINMPDIIVINKWGDDTGKKEYAAFLAKIKVAKNVESWKKINE